MKNKTLLVIIPDYITEIIKKGEYPDRYYNPGELFDEVHILMTNDDRPDPAALQRTVGSARLFLHNLPFGRLGFFWSLGLRPWLLKWWAKPAVELARQIQPALIRCHANYLNAFVAMQIKRELGIPYLVSLHINFDEDVRKQSQGLKSKLYYAAMKPIAAQTLLHADKVLPVYQPIIPYLKKIGVERYEVAYNVVNPAFLRKKEDYRLHHPVRLISVGRHFQFKNPENIIRALRRLPEAELTLVGDGPYQSCLQNLAVECGVAERTIFRPSIPNDELCASLADYDIFVVHTEHWEISKAALEAFLVGMPVVINRRLGEPVPELKDDFLTFVENTEESYYAALKKMMEDDALRERLGRAAYAHAQKHWAPAVTEANYARIYREHALGGAEREQG